MSNDGCVRRWLCPCGHMVLAPATTGLCSDDVPGNKTGQHISMLRWNSHYQGTEGGSKNEIHSGGGRWDPGGVTGINTDCRHQGEGQARGRCRYVCGWGAWCEVVLPGCSRCLVGAEGKVFFQKGGKVVGSEGGGGSERVVPEWASL